MRLVDSSGRETTDLRASITAACNFRCVYCHNEGQGEVQAPRGPTNDELGVDEYDTIFSIAKEFDITTLKITGGEPMIRRDLEEIVATAKAYMKEVSMTTNGSLLAARALKLREAGLDRINVSLDAIDPHAFHELTHGSITPVLRGIKAAVEAGITPVKINMVVFKPTLRYIDDMIRFVGGGEGLTLQLIEFMPELVGKEEWRVDIGEVKRSLEARASHIEVRPMHHRRIYHIEGARVEVVDPVGNAEFCANCHRIRLTADGKLKGCLNRNDNLIDIRGQDEGGIREGFRKVVAERVPYYGGFVSDERAVTLPLLVR